MEHARARVLPFGRSWCGWIRSETLLGRPAARRHSHARDRGDIELLERIAKDPQAFILKQGWASVSLDGERGLIELRSLYLHLQTRILEMIESLDDLRASAEMEILREVDGGENVITGLRRGSGRSWSGRSGN